MFHENTPREKRESMVLPLRSSVTDGWLVTGQKPLVHLVDGGRPASMASSRARSISQRDASHELRTPLTAIDGAAQLLARQPMAPQAQVQRIRQACAHMAQCVETLLALAERAVVDHAHLLDGKAVEVTLDIAAQVRISYDGSALVVADSGLGIGAAVQGKVFEAGVKGRDSPGSGLGLSIASRLAQRCGLVLALEQGASGGTRATLRPS